MSDLCGLSTFLKTTGTSQDASLSRATALDMPYKSSQQRFPIKLLKSKFGEPWMILSELPRYIESESGKSTREEIDAAKVEALVNVLRDALLSDVPER